MRFPETSQVCDINHTEARVFPLSFGLWVSCFIFLDFSLVFLMEASHIQKCALIKSAVLSEFSQNECIFNFASILENLLMLFQILIHSLPLLASGNLYPEFLYYLIGEILTRKLGFS